MARRGEARVRVLASRLQYTDVLIRRHLYPHTAGLRPPFVLGDDVVGEIDQVSEAHRRIEAGGLEGKLVLCPAEGSQAQAQNFAVAEHEGTAMGVVEVPQAATRA